MHKILRFSLPWLLTAALLILILPIAPGIAQEAPQEETTEEGEAETPDNAARPSDGPFIEAMSRLSTVLGSMHFLRELCGDEEKSIWRDEMTALLQAQSPNDADRRRLIASFNSGYRAYESTYRHCTEAARVAHNRYQKEGASLSRDILTRYGN
ncbi:TIGR02301 family protein [Fulvimarina sp. MAC8]|uniref:TIGR02301 family protein n=1 Tax=Fulvimarina sp. MAC8 TaxID=3162874 RepID=UPI0032EDEE05